MSVLFSILVPTIVIMQLAEIIANTDLLDPIRDRLKSYGTIFSKNYYGIIHIIGELFLLFYKFLSCCFCIQIWTSLIYIIYIDIPLEDIYSSGYVLTDVIINTLFISALSWASKRYLA